MPSKTIACFLVCFIGTSPVGWAQSPTYRFEQSDDPVQDRNAYLLTLLSVDPRAREAIAHNRVLQDLGGRLTKSREAVYAACKETKACPVDQMVLNPMEIEKVGDELATLARVGGPLSKLVHDEMRASGRFQKYAGSEDSAFMRASWSETAQGVNRLYRVYALGENLPSAKIDGPLYEAGSDSLRHDLESALGAEIDGASTDVFFSAWAHLGFDLLVIQQRTEAGRYEPLEEGENAAAFARARTTDWKAQRYTAILVPGIGLSEGESGVSPMGSFRIRMASRRWREGLAPFIIVSGGHVHPNRTPYSEAVEMKRALIAQYHIPEAAVVVDPYARHTTTNLRNATRLLFRMGAPFEKAMVITSSEDGSQYIQSREFADRCARELGYQPVDLLDRLSPFDLAAHPNLISLHADLQDPLDP
ncbi:MAG TPA: YdcF family protein [Terriglobales bacterium]|nr:YdcF family protein [Terriglobales bacterium]